MNRHAVNAWDMLALAVRARRGELGLTQYDVRERGGPSPAIMGAIENTRQTQLSPRLRRALDRALQWEPGSVNAILAGGDVTAASADLPESAASSLSWGSAPSLVASEVGVFEAEVHSLREQLAAADDIRAAAVDAARQAGVALGLKMAADAIVDAIAAAIADTDQKATEAVRALIEQYPAGAPCHLPAPKRPETAVRQ